MFSVTDTIVAIATPPGRGGIGVVRLSGACAPRIAMLLLGRTRPLAPRHATLGEVRPAENLEGPPRIADQVVATYFPAPHSYTGDDVVEISAHGSPIVLRGIVEGAIACGARLAAPGEFTLRAHVNGRIDLMQAEAVADLIDAVTPLQARTAFDQLEGTLTRAIGEIDRALFDLVAKLEASVDFPEEGYHFAEPAGVADDIGAIADRTGTLLSTARRGRLVREGLHVAILGRPNVGKSSLFNALAGADRAIVTDVPGTTRDLVTETIDLDGLRVTLTDTAGLRDTSNSVESEGVARSKGAADVSDLILLVVDRSQADDTPPMPRSARVLLVANKSDLDTRPGSLDADAVAVSAKTGDGLDALRRRILLALDVEPARDRPAITNLRHIGLVERAHDALLRAQRAARSEDGGSLPEEFVLADLQDARAALEEITGARAPEDLLAHIFSRFCIGK